MTTGGAPRRRAAASTPLPIARHLHLVWEITQAIIALLITGATIVGILIGARPGENVLIEHDTLINAFFLVIGFYFGRTNGAAIRRRV